MCVCVCVCVRVRVRVCVCVCNKYYCPCPVRLVFPNYQLFNQPSNQTKYFINQPANRSTSKQPASQLTTALTYPSTHLPSTHIPVHPLIIHSPTTQPPTHQPTYLPFTHLPLTHPPIHPPTRLLMVLISIHIKQLFCFSNASSPGQLCWFASYK